MIMNMGMQHEHGHEYAEWNRTCSMDMDIQHNMEMQHGHGHAAWTRTSSMDMDMHMRLVGYRSAVLSGSL
jgi:hypothetical protein